jgi:hypothetical protein
MEPTRKALEFERLDDATVILVRPDSSIVEYNLYRLGDELFAEWLGTFMIALLKDGFTLEGFRWEHFRNLPCHIHCNALGRITICPVSKTTTPASSPSFST